jgi:hypothetical protein
MVALSIIGMVALTGCALALTAGIICAFQQLDPPQQPSSAN